jgi:methyltransferase (TIGR00027 family)
MAERLVGPAELRLITEHPVSQALQEDYQKGRQNTEVSGMSNLLLIRTRFIEERMADALAAGATQIVILGAGFDTRAYRYSDILRDKTVFEVDYRSTQQIKRQRLAAVLGALPSHVRFAEIDFKRDTLRKVLSDAGYRPEETTFFIWEGVSMYLTASAVRDTLQTIAAYSAPGSSLVMDFAGEAMVDLLRDLPELPQHKYTTAWGEPWTFGVPDGRECEFFRECGLELRRTLSFVGAEARRRYLTRADGTTLGPVRGGIRRRRLRTLIKMLWRFATRRSKWYAMAELVTLGPHFTHQTVAP